MPKHIHADLISEYARLSHITDKPWEYFEIWNELTEVWVLMSDYHQFRESEKYRLKPRTIKIGEIEFPAPVSNPDLFKLGEENDYFMPSIRNGVPDYLISYWSGCVTDLGRLNAGIIHLDSKSAKLHAKALISLTSK
ncbi:hypothetical protein J8V57_09790 [Xenorhabdus sp. PB61.4]|uniref:hypothetical protein n=1 Tax=Xenorhabdus sp. PB61.4 TaxID=2788940 RepID=UPI001E4220C2|nr:hypothetical protein [Xenorhabdus sp. PB61.4]MCC8366572.1 hypothetical protein [Xenorhabdus sp. PB61.4]